MITRGQLTSASCFSVTGRDVCPCRWPACDVRDDTPSHRQTVQGSPGGQAQAAPHECHTAAGIIGLGIPFKLLALSGFSISNRTARDLFASCIVASSMSSSSLHYVFYRRKSHWNWSLCLNKAVNSSHASTSSVGRISWSCSLCPGTHKRLFRLPGNASMESQICRLPSRPTRILRR